jgi:triosephosphate isomerase
MTFWVGTGWKMNKTVTEARAAARVLRDVTDWPAGIQPFILPPFTALDAVTTELAHAPVMVGAQNMHWEDQGAWTGEISAPMLATLGIRLVELGHSERREFFNETDDTVNRKVHAAFRHGLTPLICIGETAREREWGAAHDILSRQVRIALHGLPTTHAARALIAYEPVWAIGAFGRAADPDMVAEALRGIRTTLRAISPELDAVPLLYGGSVTEANAPAFAALPEVGGLFIGRAAWDPEALIRIVRSVGRR